MRTIRSTKVGENMVYTLVWATIFLIPIMNTLMMSEVNIDFNKVIISWGKVSPYFLIFIVNNSILAPYLLLRNRYIWYTALLLIMLITIFATIEILDFRYWQSDDDLRNRASFTDLSWYWNILLGIFMAGANSMIKLYYRTLATAQRMAILERENIETQMQYLKYQINPHFLMNTLNNIHAMIDFDSEMAKRSVIKLSQMMRHVLYDSSEQHTTLDKEIDFVHSYIELMRIRYFDEVDIKLTIPNIQDCRKISLPPLMLIVVIENAFKHGISYNRKSFIHIEITHYNDYLKCRVENSRHHISSNEKSSGIGLSNLTKRLQLLYGNDYSLKIDDHDDKSYIVELIVPTQPIRQR